jgi:hypothetical protein
LVHVSFGEGDEVEGLQIWESQDAWVSNMPNVLPVLQAAGIPVDPNQPPTAIPALSLQGSKLKS